MNKYIDMHIHSTYSDGELTIEELIKNIIDNNVSTFSITDHDSIESSHKISKMEVGELNYISGVEVSSAINNYNIHLLGYDYNGNTIAMEKLFDDIAFKRRQRIVDILEYLYKKHNIKILDNDLENMLSNANVIGKPHVIELLSRYGYGNSNHEIYIKYLKEYKSKINYRADINDSIKAIKEANGIVILAHPKEIENEYNVDINDIIIDLIKKGIDGIEVYNSLHNLNDIKRYLETAKKYDLLISGGSDYHGTFTKPTVKIGSLSQENCNVKKLSLIDKLKNNKR